MTALLEACFAHLGEGALDCWLECKQRNLKPGDMWLREFAQDHNVDMSEIEAILAPPPAPENLRVAIAQLVGVLLKEMEADLASETQEV